MEVLTCKNCLKGFVLWLEKGFLWHGKGNQKRKRIVDPYNSADPYHQEQKFFCTECHDSLSLLVLENAKNADRVRLKHFHFQARKCAIEVIQRYLLLPSVLASIIGEYLSYHTEVWNLFISPLSLKNDKEYLWFVPTESPLSKVFAIEFPFNSYFLIDINSDGNNIYACEEGYVENKERVCSILNKVLRFWVTDVKAPIMKWSVVCEILCPPTFVPNASMAFRVDKDQVLFYESPEKVWISTDFLNFKPLQACPSPLSICYPNKNEIDTRLLREDIHCRLSFDSYQIEVLCKKECPYEHCNERADRLKGVLGAEKNIRQIKPFLYNQVWGALFG